MEVKNIRKFESVFMKASHGANDGYLSKNIYGRSSFRNKCLCLSPVPGLSNHMHRDTFTPLVDWEKIMKALSEKK
jgi:hypothetical protein